MYDIKHHGAVNGVTGSCHQLSLDGSLFSNYEARSVLIDCGLFQGAESFDRDSGEVSSQEVASQKQIDFAIDKGLF